MSVVEKLSSKREEKSGESNKKVAADCLQNPSLLGEIADNLMSADSKLAGDCAEVFTMTATIRPEIVAPYSEAICGIRLHPVTRVRWEAAHGLAFIAHLRPDLIAGMIPELMETIRHDESIIVRDYSIDILANFSSVSESNALQAFPALIESLQLWNGRHAGHALAGLENVAHFLPGMKSEIRAIIQPFLSSEKEVIRKAARKVSKASR
ncbi:MAG: hypothetical protein AB9891_09780 [Anaerolineaceae bacterium]